MEMKLQTAGQQKPGNEILRGLKLKSIEQRFEDVKPEEEKLQREALLQSEQKLREANRELSFLFNNVQDVLYSMDMLDYKITQISPACEKLYGYTPAEFYADPDIWVKVMHPDDVYLAQESMTNLMLDLHSTNQCRVIRKDKSIRWVEWSMNAALDEKGQLHRIDGIVRDITEMKNAEEQLRQSERMVREFFESAPEAITIVDMNTGKFVDFNGKALKMYKCSAEEILQKGPIDVSPALQPDGQDSATRAMEMIGLAMEGKDPVFEWTHCDSEGTPLPCEVRITKLSIPGRNLIRGSVIDISEKKQAQAEIAALNESLERKVHERTAELETANKELESFSYSVSHDLRAPLRVINGYCKMLLKNTLSKLGERDQQDLHVIMSNAEHMGHLIDDLLDFSRLGRTSVAKNQVDMTGIIKTVIEEVKAATGSKAPIKLQEFEPVSCDPVLIKQVWANLISNAVKYSAKTENPLIEIGSTMLCGQQTYFIKDNGAGFDMQFYDKLFAVFQRLHKVTEYEGTGVGLSLVQRIVNKHGGKIWADGKVNEGAIFYFTLSN